MQNDCIDITASHHIEVLPEAGHPIWKANWTLTPPVR